MNVCDHCKRLPIGKNRHDAAPIEYSIIGVKTQDPTKSGGKSRATEKEVVRIPLSLCDPCITIFNRKLGYFIHGIREEVMSDPDPALKGTQGAVSERFSGRFIETGEPNLSGMPRSQSTMAHMEGTRPGVQNISKRPTSANLTDSNPVDEVLKDPSAWVDLSFDQVAVSEETEHEERLQQERDEG